MSLKTKFNYRVLLCNSSLLQYFNFVDVRAEKLKYDSLLINE